MTLGHFGPRALCPRIFWSLVILAWDISVPGHSALGHFSHRSIGSWVISAQVRAKNILVQGHLPRTFRSLAILGSSSFRFLVIWPKLFWANVISVPGHNSPVILVPGHFVHGSFWSPVFTVPGTIWCCGILVPGHIDLRVSFGYLFILARDISVPGHFSLGQFHYLVIWFPGCFSLGSFQSLVIQGFS